MGTVFIRGEGGSIFEMDLPLHETIIDKLRKGAVQRVDADGSPVPVEDVLVGVPGLPTERPALGAVKAEWVGWAVACGADPDAADGMTKAELVEQYNESVPVAPE